MPEELDDREADNWTVLFAIADEAGGEWSKRVRKAAEAAHVAAANDPDSRLELLLRDIRTGFAEQGTTVQDMLKVEQRIISSARLVKFLVGLAGRPWADGMGRGSNRPITSNLLTAMLKPLGIITEKVGPKDKRLNGYVRAHFEDSYMRYLGPEGSSELDSRTTPDEMGTSGISKADTSTPGCPVVKCEKSNNDGQVSERPAEKGNPGAKAHAQAPKAKSDDLPYDGPVVEVPDLGPDQFDEHGASSTNGQGSEAPTPNVPPGRIRELADWCLGQAVDQNAASATGDVNRAKIEDDLRLILREETTSPEEAEAAFTKVMAQLFAV